MRMCCQRIDIAEWMRSERCEKMRTWHGTELEACIDLAFGMYITERKCMILISPSPEERQMHV